jgi:tyrosyl-tRNA synthetase
MGGSDQWGNIVAGIDLIRRTQNKTAFGITFPLITTSSGIKMGKTHKGAVWLDPERTSPYDYYQFWINTDDADVIRFLLLFTFLPLNEIEELRRLEGSDLNPAKVVLAFEATSIAHGKQSAEKAFRASVSVFGLPVIPDNLLPSSDIPRGNGIVQSDDSIPCTCFNRDVFVKGISAFQLFADIGLSKSKSDARRLLNQGGGYLNGQRVKSFDQILSLDDFQDNRVLLRAGKKRYHKIVLE